MPRPFLLLFACLVLAAGAARADVRVADIGVRVDFDATGPGAILRGTVRLEAAAANADTPAQGLRIELTDAKGKSLLAQPLVTAASVRDFSLRLAEAPRWSAENPVLAGLTVSVLDASRAVLSSKTVPIGFREIARTDGRIFVNGAPIRLRGVTAPAGLASAEERLATIKGWKRANVNAVLVPADANPADWLSLCDRLGLYVVVVSDDAVNAAEPVRAHPSFLLALNEIVAVSNPATMQAFLASGARLDGFAHPTLVNATLDGPRDRPIVAAGLQPDSGELAVFWQEIYWHPRLLGAFLAPSVDATAAGVKKVYQPVLIERRRMKPGDVVVRVTNRHHHRSLDAYEPRWAVLRDGKVVQQGVLPALALAPNAQPEVPIPVAPIAAPVAGATYALRLSFHTRAAGAWAPAGHEIAYEELPLDVAVPALTAR